MQHAAGQKIVLFVTKFKGPCIPVQYKGMKNFFRGTIFFPVVLVLVCCGYYPSGDAGAGDFTVVVWNLQSLFDGQEAGNEYAEFREGWTQEKYQARLMVISQALRHMAEEGAPINGNGREKSFPGLIGLVEIENAGVLVDLARGELQKNGYSWSAFTSLTGSSLGIGVLSRFPLKDVRAHSITVGMDTAPRPVLEVRVEPAGAPLVFLLCHWKSKLGSNTEEMRRASARVVHRRLCELKEAEPGTPVVVMGDLNENHDEYFRYGERFDASALCALLPDDPGAAELAGKDLGGTASLLSFGTPGFLVLSREKPPDAEFFPDGIPALYSTWWEMADGSYYYKGGWETIDHFLLSEGLFGSSGWIFSGSWVLNHEPFVTSKGTPNAYVARYGRGLSDHLPLMLHLKYLGE